MQAIAISAASLAAMFEQFLAGAPEAVVIEDGELLFDFATARYSISGEGKCVLHLWSEERNTVRRVVDAMATAEVLRLQVLRFGQSQPTMMEISASYNLRTGAAKRTARKLYQSALQRVLRHDYPGFKLDCFSGASDLEHSFSPVYTRGLLRAGQSAFAVLGVNCGETQASVDGSLTFAILWLDYQRQRLAGKAQVEGLKLYLPKSR